MNRRLSTADLSSWSLANVLVVGVIGYAYLLDSGYPDFYHASIQEDEYLEWSTFWAFVLAGITYLRNGALYRRSASRIPWFLFGVAVFCIVVALEEISWGQRQIGYRPPSYFLENNFQQEFNFHNTIDSDFRQFALAAVIAGFGVLLPVAAQVKAVMSWFTSVGIVAPTITLLPAFATTFLLYQLYPWSHTGEWVELMLGLGFLFAALLTCRDFRLEQSPEPTGFWHPLTLIAGGFVAAIGLGLASAAYSNAQTGASAESLRAASMEVAALVQDFENGLAATRCNRHKRLYTFVREYRQTGLYQGNFARLQARGLPKERAEYFLDPWNSPYWIRDRCDRQSGRRIVFVYSFGPDRRRDSTNSEILGDDVGIFLFAQ